MTVRLGDMPIVEIGAPFGPTCAYQDHGLMPLNKFTVYEPTGEYDWVECLLFEERPTGWFPTETVWLSPDSLIVPLTSKEEISNEQDT